VLAASKSARPVCETPAVSDAGYAQAEDGTNVAYRVLTGDTPPGAGTDIVMLSGGMIPVEVFDDEPGFARMLDGLASLGRLVVFDRRGLGASDPITDWDRSILDQWTEDLAAVVDASGVVDPVVFAWDGFGVASRFAATHPDRLCRLVLYHPMTVEDGKYAEWAEDRRRFTVDGLKESGLDLMALVAPSHRSDPSFVDWYNRAGRVGASPATAGRVWDAVFNAPPDVDIERVATPTLVLARRDNAIAPVAKARLTAERIPGATYVELDGADHFPFLGDVDSVLAEITAFVVGERRLPPPQRIVAAVLFTDLVGSTERAVALGDKDWKSLLDRHDAAVRGVVGRSGGTVVKTTGDGVLALLPSANEALRAADRLHTALAIDGLEVRIGIHVGDIDRRGDDVSGLAVNIAARVMSVAGTGQTFVTASVPVAVAGQPVEFATVGEHQLKGVPGSWELFEVTDG
jgi:class 3 adenylate cyclase/alpha-beta hydrolase superfamily lysophospholipase